MREEVRKRIVDVIDQEVFWLKIVPEDQLYKLMPSSCRQPFIKEPEDIIVRVLRRHGSLYRGMFINLTASSLSEAIVKLSKDRIFANRCSQDQLTNADVKKIVSTATYGIVELNFYDY